MANGAATACSSATTVMPSRGCRMVRSFPPCRGITRARPAAYASWVNLGSEFIQRVLHLDDPLTRDVVVQRGLRVPMPDGVVLLADRWAPRAGGDGLPVALLRTPYGRGRLVGAAMARPLAERGFQVLMQSGARDVRVGRDVPADAGRAGRRAGDPGMGQEAAVVRRRDRALRRQLPRLRPVGGGRPAAARGQGDDPARDRRRRSPWSSSGRTGSRSRRRSAGGSWSTRRSALARCCGR